MTGRRPIRKAHLEASTQVSLKQGKVWAYGIENVADKYNITVSKSTFTCIVYFYYLNVALFFISTYAE